jgi:hypothetical protein
MISAPAKTIISRHRTEEKVEICILKPLKLKNLFLHFELPSLAKNMFFDRLENRPSWA